MNPVKFKQAYGKELGAGDNPNTGDLPFCRAIEPTIPGRVFLISCWQPTKEELERIIATGEIYIGIMGHPSYATQPPVCVMGLNPFAKDGEEKHTYGTVFKVINEGALIPVPVGMYDMRAKGMDRCVEDDSVFSPEALAEMRASQVVKDADEIIRGPVGNGTVNSKTSFADGVNGEKLATE